MRSRWWVVLGIFVVAASLAGAWAVVAPRPSEPAARAPADGAVILPMPDPDDGHIRFRLVRPDGTTAELPIDGHARSCPTFSPDGRALAYIGAIDGQKGLILAAADGSDPRFLWRGTFDDQTFHQVTWSPDGTRVAATQAMRQPDGRVSGTIVSFLDGRASRFIERVGGEGQGGVSWSPQGQLAAIAWDGETSTVNVIDLETGARHAIGSAPSIHAVSWSTDGSMIAYTAATTTDWPGDPDLFLVGADGAGLHPVWPRSKELEEVPAWSPDGRWLAVTSLTGGGGGVVPLLIDPRAGAVRSLDVVLAPGNLFMTWSPDSRWLLFSTGGAQDGEKPTLVPIDGGPVRRLGAPDGEYYTQCPLTWQAV